MIDHIGLRTAWFESSKPFFRSALAPPSITPKAEYPGGVGFAHDGAPAFWLGESASAPSGMHMAFQAPSRAAVDASKQSATRP